LGSAAFTNISINTNLLTNLCVLTLVTALYWLSIQSVLSDSHYFILSLTICPEQALLTVTAGTSISRYPFLSFYILTYSYLHFYLCYPIRCLTLLFHPSYYLLLLRSHFYIFWTLLTDYSQSLPPYPTESKSYLHAFILYWLLIIISHGRYI